VGGTGAGYTFDLPVVSTSGDQPGLPPGLTLTAGGLLSGTPTSTGVYNFRLTIHDSGGNTFSRNFGVTVADFLNGGGLGGLFVIRGNNQGNPPDTSVGQWTEFSPNLLSVSSGFRDATWSIVGGSLPPGMTLVMHEIQGRPSTPGTYAFTVRGNDVASPTQFAQREF